MTAATTPRLLLVADSRAPQVQRLVPLLRAGFDVCAVGDAEQGFARLGAEPFAIVVTDMVLPGGSGFDLCRRIKAEAAHAAVPVVIMTSQGNPLNVLRGLQAGADGFLTKDRPATEMLGRLRRVLEGRQAPAGQQGADAPRSPASAPAGQQGADAPRSPASAPAGSDSARVAFLNAEFDLAVGKPALVNALLGAFEDLVYLQQKSEKKETELRKTNVEQQQGSLDLQKVNVELQKALRLKHEALNQLKTTQSQLVQAEKLSALGLLVSGVAHEINDPLAVVSNDIGVLHRDTEAMRQALELYRQADEHLAAACPDLLARLHDLAEREDLPYVLTNLERLLARSRDGLGRIDKIVRSLRHFARLDEGEAGDTDLNSGIEATVSILRGQAAKRGVELLLDLAPLPPVYCFSGQINQVVLNLTANALDACSSGGKVGVRTCSAGGGVEIHVVDTGKGIDPAIRDKIFDPFFTTKPPGQGTGLGLSISYGIVQEHGGRLTFESTPGQGTHFVMWLPFRRAEPHRQEP